MHLMTEETPLLGIQNTEIQVQEDRPIRLGLFTSIAYIISVFGIAPIVALPGAIEYCGVFGFLLVTVLLTVEAYTAILLGKSWVMLEENWPKEAIIHSKYPYPALAQRVGGVNFRRLVSVLQDLAIFGEAVPFLLLSSENMQKVISEATNEEVNFSYCYVIICMAIFLIPFLWLGTPKDLRHLSWVGAVAVVVVSILTLCLIFLYAPRGSNISDMFPPWSPIAYCFGAVAFQFDIHPMILTLQMDMKDKRQLSTAIVISFVFAFVVFGMISAGAFFLFGENLKANILNNFEGGYLLYITRGIVGFESCICLALGINTLFQDLEDTFRIPSQFGWKRVLLRTSIMMGVLFVSESIPHFGVALELVGGLLVTPFVFIFPPMFYLIIKSQTDKIVHLKEIILGAEIILIGVIGCIASTVESSIQISLLPEFAPPCYIDLAKASIIPE